MRLLRHACSIPHLRHDIFLQKVDKIARLSIPQICSCWKKVIAILRFLILIQFVERLHYMNTEITTVDQSIVLLKTAIQDGINAWERAGREIVNLIDINRMSLEEIAEKANCDFITPNVLAQFERIGRGQVMPKLLVMDFPASRHLQRMPLSEQQRLIDGTVQLLVIRDNGTDALMVNTKDLTKDQCKQVFSKDGVRSLGGQRAFIEDRRKKIPCTASTPSWQIKAGKVIFNSACELTRQELAVILAQLA